MDPLYVWTNRESHLKWRRLLKCFRPLQCPCSALAVRCPRPWYLTRVSPTLHFRGLFPYSCLRTYCPTQSLVVDLQRAGHVVEFERKKAALDQFIQAIRDPVGRFSVRVRREQIVGDVIKAFSPLKLMDENYKKQPSVTFIGEPGIDAGGLTR